MAVIDWPLALPPLPLTTSSRLDPNYIVTETDHGPNKKRRRYSAVSTRVAVQNWHLKGDDFETLKHFYLNDTQGGSIAFNMPKPTNTEFGQTPEARFDSEINWELVIPSDHAGTRRVRVDFLLEILP